MTVSEIFKEYADADIAINSKLDYLAELRKMRSKMRFDNENSVSLEAAEKTIARIEEEVSAEIKSLCEIREIIRFMIKSMPNVLHRAVLERRYLMRENWKTVSEKIGYTVRHTTRFHKAAMDYLNTMYPDITINKSN